MDDNDAYNENDDVDDYNLNGLDEDDDNLNGLDEDEADDDKSEDNDN